MARSRESPVAVTAPPVVLRCVPAILTPRPIWNGVVPPELVEGAEPRPRLRLKTVEKSSRLDLNAVVLMLAMLLPMTSMFRELAVRPESPVYRALVEGMGESSGTRNAELGTRNQSGFRSKFLVPLGYGGPPCPWMFAASLPRLVRIALAGLSRGEDLEEGRIP